MASLEQSNTLLLFRVGPVRCCAPSLPVETIIQVPALNHPPGSSADHPGIFRCNDRIVSVVDLRYRFGVEEKDWRPGRLIVVHLDQQLLGFWVDEIIDVIERPAEGWGRKPALIPHGVFSRTLFLDERIYLYCEFAGLAALRQSGYLKRYIAHLQAQEATAASPARQAREDTKALRPDAPASRPTPAERATDLPASPLADPAPAPPPPDGARKNPALPHNSVAQKPTAVPATKPDKGTVAASRRPSALAGPPEQARNRPPPTKPVQGKSPLPSSGTPSAGTASRASLNKTTEPPRQAARVAGKPENGNRTPARRTTLPPTAASRLHGRAPAPDRAQAPHAMAASAEGRGEGDIGTTTNRPNPMPVSRPAAPAPRPAPPPAPASAWPLVMLLLVFLALGGGVAVWVLAPGEPPPRMPARSVASTPATATQVQAPTPVSEDLPPAPVSEAEPAPGEAVPAEAVPVVVAPAVAANETDPASPAGDYQAEIAADEEGITIVLHTPNDAPVLRQPGAEDAEQTPTAGETATPRLEAPQPTPEPASQAGEAGQTAPPPPPPVETASPPATASPPRLHQPRRMEIIHIVVKGDTLWDIAARYVNDPYLYPELARLSRIRNPDLIYPGDRVRIVQVISP